MRDKDYKTSYFLVDAVLWVGQFFLTVLLG